MSGLEISAVVILVAIGYASLGFLIGFTRGHRQAMDAWQKSNREIFGKGKP